MAMAKRDAEKQCREHLGRLPAGYHSPALKTGSHKALRFLAALDKQLAGRPEDGLPGLSTRERHPRRSSHGQCATGPRDCQGTHGQASRFVVSNLLRQPALKASSDEAKIAPPAKRLGSDLSEESTLD